MSSPRPLNAGEADRPLPDELVDPHPHRLDRGRPDSASVLAAHRRAVTAGRPHYVDPSTGWTVLTALFLWERGTCCDSGCRHCPYYGDRDGSRPGSPLP